MKLPYWLFKLLPMWDYICPCCRREVSKNNHKCQYCGERFIFPLKVPPKCLKDPKTLEEYVHKHVFPRVSAGQREYLAKYFTTIFAHGFDCGTFTCDDLGYGGWTGISNSGGTITVVTANPHHGNYNAKADITTAGATYACVYKTFTEQPIAYARAYVKFEELLTTDGYAARVMYLYRSLLNASIGEVLIYKISGVVKWGMLYRNNGVYTRITADTPLPQTNVWYCVELLVDCSSADGVYDGMVKVWIDGNNIFSVTNIDTDYTTINNLYVIRGRSYHESGNTDIGTTFFDCVVLADTYIGQEVKLKPSSNIIVLMRGMDLI